MTKKRKKNVMLKRDKNISKQRKAKDRKTEIQNAKKIPLECYTPTNALLYTIKY